MGKVLASLVLLRNMPEPVGCRAGYRLFLMNKIGSGGKEADVYIVNRVDSRLKQKGIYSGWYNGIRVIGGQR